VAALEQTGSKVTRAFSPHHPPAIMARNVQMVIRTILFREIIKMAKKGTAGDAAPLYYANLAVVAEQTGNYEDAAKQWRRASGASLKADSIVLYEEAAKRCERRSKGEFGPNR
jgi:hypothetical protein